jgi:integrase
VTHDGLGNLMREACDEAGLAECSSHGLRKACARRLAEAGATANEIAAVTGHKCLAEVTRYTRAADKAGLADAAMGKLGTKRQQDVANHPKRFANRAAKPLKDK